ncbi:hypothetical protein ACH6EH_16715 [Paenibacillus sp. JSM ZJ436]|uniref:hypothetical protein n=1 Tax=Paenibacillus sp. JSM ZJ436 TaxID=3376190 RepID=UPI0037ABD4DA
MEYTDLPERMENKVLRLYFVQFLNYLNEGSMSIERALYHLKELTCRQWYTFELLDEQIRQSIDEWLIQIWDPHSVEKAEVITFIVANLGLTDTYAFLKQIYSSISSEEVKIIVGDTIRELKDSAANPYMELNQHFVM